MKANPTWQFVTSSIGKKVVMAVSGFVLVGFVIGHMIGNLQFFAGPEAINNYAHMLKGMPVLLWTARGCLLICIFLHIVAGIAIARENSSANVQNSNRKNLSSTIGSRMAMPLGMVLLIFILLHLAHYTFLWFNPEYAYLLDSEGLHDVYGMMVAGFSSPPYSIFYIISMVALSWHLGHGIASMFQTLGLANAKLFPIFKKISMIVGILVAIGFAIVPMSVLLGVIK